MVPAAATAAAIAAAYPKAASVARELVAVAERLGAPPFVLANLIQFESGWNPRAVNPTSGASGLIQFMPSTAKRLGTTVEAIRRLDAAGQLPLVERYLAPFKGRLGSQQAVAMAVFYPVAMTWPEDKPFPTAVQRANPGIRTPADYVAKLLRRARLTSAEQVAVRGAKVAGSAWLIGGLTFAAVLAWRAWRAGAFQGRLPGAMGAGRATTQPSGAES